MTGFDVHGPLPTGTTILEASAGTGKTFTIAELATRYLAEGSADVRQLLVVTFGRDATRELRDRIRGRLSQTLIGLQGGDQNDDLVHLLRDVPAAVERLQAAVSNFDAATITTTHGFCQTMLKRLGIVADADPDATFVDSLEDLIAEVVTDFYVRQFGKGPPGGESWSIDEARKLASTVVADPQAQIFSPRDVPANQRSRFAAAVRAEVDARRRQRRLRTYDDLIADLAHALREDSARQRLRSEFAVVMVDEFQDTDPLQWQILRDAFHGHRTLTLIGDPKQSIYRFRGADLNSYLDARGVADHRETLARNFRSDADVVTAITDLFAGVSLGSSEITVTPLQCEHERSRISAAPARLRRDVSEVDAPPVSQVRKIVARDVAQDIVGHLTIGFTLVGQPLQPADIAVLVNRHEQAELIHNALTEVGVPAVRRSADSVFTTPAAGQWLTLLEALEQPQRDSLVRPAILTDFFEWTPTDLALRGPEIAEAANQRLRDWSRTWTAHGIAAVLGQVVTDTDLYARLLSRSEGERVVTDIRHVGEILHAQAQRTGRSGLLEWLRVRIRDASSDNEQPRRLQTDAAAVQILTIHASKGLQFPVVYLPFAWDRFRQRDQDTAAFHDDAGRRMLDVTAGGHEQWRAHQQQAESEGDAESLRLLYVAMTRAINQVVLWWMRSPKNTAASPLHRLMHARANGDADARPDYPVRLGYTGMFQVEDVGEGTRQRWQPPTDHGRPLEAAAFDRTLDLQWRRTSYSGLTRDAHEAGARIRDDEPETTTPASDTGPRSPMHDLPTGANFGSLVHEALEVTDFTAGDLSQELKRACTRAWTARPLDVEPAVVAEALLPSLMTPLGALARNRRLADITPADRLPEMDFEIPLHAGMPLSAISALLATGLLPDDPLVGYTLDSLTDRRLRGYLAGSIDAVLRVDDSYLVVDYKTNWLGPVDAPLYISAYSPSAMAEAMKQAHYPLQSLLYQVALHRFLRWRLPGYDPHTHLGGSLYLFLRGMSGGPEGVFAWQPPPSLIVELSDRIEAGQ